MNPTKICQVSGYYARNLLVLNKKSCIKILKEKLYHLELAEFII